MGSASENLQALIREFYSVWFRFHPAAVLKAGVSGYAGTLPAVRDDDVSALGSWLESTIVGLEEIDFHALAPAEQIDLELLFGACRDEYQAILKRDWRHRDPLAFMPFQTICRLLLDAGGEGQAALEACLKGIPSFLSQARSVLAEFPGFIPRIWVDVALRVGDDGVAFLRQLSDKDDTTADLRALCEQVAQAVADYLKFLREDIAPAAEGTAVCGEQRFREQLRLRHHLPDRLDAPLELARQIYQTTRAELGVLSLEQCGSSDPRTWLEKLSRRDPLQHDAKLQYVRRRQLEIHGLLTQSGQFVMPDSASLELRQAPEECQLECAPVYRAPLPGGSGAPGVLYLEQALSGGSADTPERLTAWCVHNAWPGRHMQAAAASCLAGTLVRRVNHSSSQQVGWSLYAEQLMHELGFFPEPEYALYRLQERLRRSLLAVLDIEMHVHGMAAAGALLQLQALPGQSAEEAARDLLSLTRHPTQHLAGVLAWKQLETLRQWQSDRGDLPPADFHALLLAQGSIAMPLVIRRVFGAQAWAWVEAQLYNQ